MSLTWPEPGSTGWNTLVESNVQSVKNTSDSHHASTSAHGIADTSKLVKHGDLVINVRDYGAVGDGVTDDTTAIQAALNAAGAAGARFVLVPGIPSTVYKVTSIAVPSGVTLFGNATITSSAFFTVSVSGTRPKVSGLKIVNTNATPGVAVSVVSNTQSPRIEDCWIDGGGASTGVDLNVTGCFDLTVEGCRFDNVGYGVLTDDVATDLHGVRVVNCTFTNVKSDAIEFNHPSSSPQVTDFVVQGCNITAALSTSSNSGFGVGAANVGKLSIVNNTFSQCSQEAVHLEAGCSSVTIDGNAISGTNTTHAVVAGVYGIQASGVSVIGNIITNINGYGIAFDYNGVVDVEKSVVVGNIVSGCASDGIFLMNNSTGYVTAANNISHDNGGSGIRTAGGFVSITGNTAFNNAAWGLSLSSDVTGRVVLGNTFYNNTSGDVTDSAALATMIQGGVGLTSVSAPAAGNTPWVNILSLGSAARGQVVINCYDDTKASYCRVFFDITWDGTTLTSPTIRSIGDVGTLGSLSVQQSGGYLQARAYNAGSARNINFNSQSNCSILI